MNRARKSRETTLRSSSLQQAGEQVRLAVAQPQARRRPCAARTTGSLTPRDGLVGAERAVVERQVEDDVAVERHARRHVDVHADVLVADTSSAGSRRRRRSQSACSWSRRPESASPRFSDSLLPSAPRSCGFAISLVLRVGLEKPDDRGRHREIEIRRADAARDRVQVERRRRRARRSAASTCRRSSSCRSSPAPSGAVAGVGVGRCRPATTSGEKTAPSAYSDRFRP